MFTLTVTSTSGAAPRDVVQAQGLQRLVQADLLAVQRDPGLGERHCHVAGLTEP